MHYIVENSCNNPESGWIELLEKVLSKYSADNSTPVHNSSVDPCSKLNINIWRNYCGTPLHVACALSNLDVVNLFLKYGADPNVCGILASPLYYALKENKNDVAKALFEHGAKIDVDYVEERLIIGGITEYSQSTVEILLPYTSNRQKNRMLQSIAYSYHEETHHDIEKAKLLLKAGSDPEFCGEIEKGELNASTSYLAKSKGKSKLVRLFNEHKKDLINNNSHCVQLSTTDNTKHNFPQKQSSGGRWIIIVPALLFGAIGATLAVMGIIPEIVAIGAVATAVLSGIAGAIAGGVAGYLADVAINQCCGDQKCATQ